MRVIARMNIGGPAHHVSLLSARLDPERYDTLLVIGRPGPGEGSFDELARREGAKVLTLPSLGPEIHPLQDVRALVALARVMRRFRPEILHTHTAKAGFLARLAALAGRSPRPAIVHTFHGHVLEGYFGPVTSRVFRLLERALGRRTDRLVAVSAATAADLDRLGVAPAARIDVIPLGLDLRRLTGCRPQDGAAVREELGLGSNDLLVMSIGRLVPIKRLDVLLRGMTLAVAAGFEGRLMIVGDGTARSDLERLSATLGLNGRVTFAGFRTDLPQLLSAADVVALTSDNEGTPVSLIEAAAASVPCIATAVGGVPEVVNEETGILIPAGDAQAFGEALVELAADRDRLRAMGARARTVVARWSAERLVEDVDRLYVGLRS